MINLGVIAALYLSDWLAAPVIDPLVALALAMVLIRGAWSIAARSIRQLMDTEFSEQDRSQIRQLALAHPQVSDIHDLRTRRAGFTAFIQLHLEMDGEISLTRAHDIADQVEATIQQAFPDAEVFIHQDPAGAERINAFLRS